MARKSKILQEGDLEFDFSTALHAYKFDVQGKKKNKHGYKHELLDRSMKAVDFIVEEKSRFLFVEVKDVGHPDNINPKDYSDKSVVAELINVLILKFRDTFIYFWAKDKLAKPIYYVCLVTTKKEHISPMQDQLGKHLPAKVPTNIWKKQFVEDYFLLNIDLWNASIFKKYKVTRL